MLYRISLLIVFLLSAAWVRGAELYAAIPASSEVVVRFVPANALNSAAWKNMLNNAPQIKSIQSVLTGELPIKPENCGEALFFLLPDGRNGGVLLRLKNLPTDKLIALLQKQPKTQISAITGTPYRAYRIQIDDDDHNVPDAAMAILSADTILLTGYPLYPHYLKLPKMTAQQYLAMLPGAIPADAFLALGYQPVKKAARKRAKNNMDPASLQGNVRQVYAYMRISGDKDAGLQLCATARCGSPEEATQLLQQCRFFLMMGMGIFFADDQKLGESFMQQLKFKADGKYLNGTLELPPVLLQRLAKHGAMLAESWATPPTDDQPSPVPAQ